MPMIVRHKQTGHYVTEGGWTKDRELARDFFRLDYARLYRSKQPNGADLEIVYRSGQETSEYDVTW